MDNGLEEYYDKSGKSGWKNMVELANKKWTCSPYQQKLLNELENHVDIAKVIYARLGKSSLEWINQSIPALENLSPRECISHPQLIKRLKEALMRMP